VAAIESRHALGGNRVYYMAIPPSAFDDTIEGLADAGLDRGPGWTRVVVEKPFGTDLESARHLNEVLHRHFSEEQIFRIDHYLAKETVQNLLVFRFANMLFESSWNRSQIDSVEITVAETLGVEGRAKYFDSAGVIRDIIQNHSLQVLTLVAMEPPVRLEADAIRDEKVKVLRLREAADLLADWASSRAPSVGFPPESEAFSGGTDKQSAKPAVQTLLLRFF
jgi:glucose-6-phosphate 1-dehydrogenase